MNSTDKDQIVEGGEERGSHPRIPTPPYIQLNSLLACFSFPPF